MQSPNKSQAAKELGIARSSLYYKPKQPTKDWEIKCSIEEVLREHPFYGHKRLAITLGVNKKRTLRVMKLYGIQPYRRRGKKWKKPPEQPEQMVVLAGRNYNRSPAWRLIFLWRPAAAAPPFP